MKIEWTKEQVEFIKKALEKVNTKAIDPIFGNLIPRIVLADDKQYKNQVVKIEEYELNNIIEGLNEFSDPDYLRDVSEEDRKRAGVELKFLADKYGMSI